MGWRRCVRSSAGGDPGVDLGLFPHPVLVGVAKPFEVGGAWGVLQKGCKAPEVAKLLIGAVELGGVVLQLLGMRMQAVCPAWRDWAGLSRWWICRGRAVRSIDGVPSLGEMRVERGALTCLQRLVQVE